MLSKQNRRNFIKSCTMFGCACCTIPLFNTEIFAFYNIGKKEIIDLSGLSYCGIACETKCELFKATKENDLEQKRKIYYSWGWKEKFNIEYDPEKVFCIGCKPGNKPLKIGMAECSARMCALKNEIASCIQCKKLKTCEKELWKKWPDFYRNILKLQEQYSAQPEASLLDIKE